MSKIIDAIFENGAFKPIQNQNIDLKEHQKVTLKVVSLDDWQDRFNRIIAKVQKKAAHYPPQEIESDIAEAIREVREAKDGRR